jgi:hypothetical protein
MYLERRCRLFYMRPTPFHSSKEVGFSSALRALLSTLRCKQAGLQAAPSPLPARGEGTPPKTVAEIVAGTCLEGLVSLGMLDRGFPMFANRYQVIPCL